jgi:hypothetical protein
MSEATVDKALNLSLNNAAQSGTDILRWSPFRICVRSCVPQRYIAAN